MDRDTAIEWASRLANRQLTKDNIGLPYGSRSSCVGEVLDAEFMIVTRSAVFRKGYKGMDPAKIPQFKEGLDHLEFATRLFSVLYDISRKEYVFSALEDILKTPRAQYLMLYARLIYSELQACLVMSLRKGRGSCTFNATLVLLSEVCVESK
ncbi:uncharacterized protein BT62DRAFT_996539 [Guyanagaster necrorhizus]|uniref:Uncharacterized protein n=1 Tax=Guyanagaster necrorhizus TaxID=856835 RepID=A0A9P7VK54_9AGAR|nr:uncharacterized protein BT62DRAFT_996539 [Guyanagaster necrorhizus MCA 3950]KAG7442603.1 hypothetical protein BT62DRAFT_996539 [Guyanagaster necrorhizus MCA 3950]